MEEALNVRVSDPNNKEECLYNLDTVLDPVSRAIEAVERGEYSEALVLLAAQAEPSAMVQRLEQKVRRCLEGQVLPERFPHFGFV